MVPEVVYLGHKIDAQGLHPLTKKVEAVQAAPVPKNVSELKSYLGLLSYYGKFLPCKFVIHTCSTIRVTEINSKMEVEKTAFQESKKLLSSAKVLDSTKEVTLACDASPYGIGAVFFP